MRGQSQNQSQRQRTRVSALHEQRAYMMRRVFRSVFRRGTRSVLLLRVLHFLFWPLQLNTTIIGLYPPPPPLSQKHVTKENFIPALYKKLLLAFIPSARYDVGVETRPLPPGAFSL